MDIIDKQGNFMRMPMDQFIALMAWPYLSVHISIVSTVGILLLNKVTGILMSNTLLIPKRDLSLV